MKTGVSFCGKQNKLMAGNKPLLKSTMNTGCIRSEESRKGRRYCIAVGIALFKDAEGKNIFTRLPNLSVGEFKLQFIFYFLLSITYS